MIALLLAQWKLVAIGLLVAALGVQTYRVQSIKAEFAEFKAEVDALGREAKAKAEAIDAHNGLVREEQEHEITVEREQRAKERALRADRFAAVYGKYLGLLNDPGSRPLPGAAPGPAQPVQPLRGCLDAERLVASLRSDLGALHGEVEALLKRGEDALDDRQHWGQWARLVGACPKP